MGYTRKFVILKKELGNMGEVGLKGHSKLEVKGPRGIIGVNIENGGANDFYNVDFIIKDRLDRIWNLGKIFVDGIGRGKGEYNFTQKDIRIEDIVGILITKDGNVFLGGYVSKEDGSIEDYLKSTAPQIKEIEAEIEVEVIEEVVEEIVEDDCFDEIENFMEELAAGPELELELDPEPEQNQDYELELDYELEPMEETQLEIEHYEEEIIDEKGSMEPDYKVIDHIKKLNQKDQTTNYVLSILRFFPYIDPFKYNLDGYNWWLVELDRENEYRSFLPYFSYLVGGNNKESYDSEAMTCNQLMDKYQHYVFGLYNENEEVKYFVYGVPGSFKKEEHPNRGGNGFNTWYEGETVDGYWILYIDPMTGKPVYPLNPMIPRE